MLALVLLTLLCLALAALLVYRERVAGGVIRAENSQLGREIEIERQYARDALDQIAKERERAAEERRELYQRIQAPETAVVEHVRRERGPYQRRKPIGADDDAAFAERNERG